MLAKQIVELFKGAGVAEQEVGRPCRVNGVTFKCRLSLETVADIRTAYGQSWTVTDGSCKSRKVLVIEATPDAVRVRSRFCSKAKLSRKNCHSDRIRK